MSCIIVIKRLFNGSCTITTQGTRCVNIAERINGVRKYGKANIYLYISQYIVRLLLCYQKCIFFIRIQPKELFLQYMRFCCVLLNGKQNYLTTALRFIRQLSLNDVLIIFAFISFETPTLVFAALVGMPIET